MIKFWRPGCHAPTLRFSVIILLQATGNIEMNSQKAAGILGAMVAAAVLAVAFVYGPIGQSGKPAKQVQKVEPPKAAPGPPPVRGPVVREVPQ